MAWRLAKALEQLRKQVNAEFPTRRKDSDGTIGNEEHANRSSDHNPWVGPGVVTALDLTHDPKNGFDSYRFAQSLVDHRDERIKYIISNGKIVSGSGQSTPAWKWRAYNGKNRHDHHVHISVKSNSTFYDDTVEWTYKMLPAGTTTTTSYVEPPPTLKKGSQGELVKKLQTLLTQRIGTVLIVDGDFGTETEAAVKKLQREKDLEDDGVVGPMTWRALGVQKLT